MAEQEETQAQQAREEVQEGEVSILDQLLSKIDATPRPQAERDQLGTAVGHLLSSIARSAERPERVDGKLIDAYIAELDKSLSV